MEEIRKILNWINLAQGRVLQRDVVNSVMNIRVLNRFKNIQGIRCMELVTFEEYILPVTKTTVKN
jgi:hypothetical protein